MVCGWMPIGLGEIGGLASAGIGFSDRFHTGYSLSELSELDLYIGGIRIALPQGGSGLSDK